MYEYEFGDLDPDKMISSAYDIIKDFFDNFSEYEWDIYVFDKATDWIKEYEELLEYRKRGADKRA